MPKIDPELLGPAIRAMHEGVGVFDHNDLLVAYNARYAFVQRSLGNCVGLGMTWHDLVETGLRQGKILEALDHEDAWLEQRRRSRGDYSAIRRTSDGRAYLVNERRIADGGFVAVWTDVTELFPDEPAAAPPPDGHAANLTDRQRDVVQLLVLGNSMKTVGRILGIAPRTVAFHKYQAMEANGLLSNADLLRFAIAQGLLPRAVDFDDGAACK